MKYFVSASLLLLPALSLANPITSPNPAPLEVRDKYCTLGATVDFDVHCRKGAGSGYDHVRWIRAADPGLPEPKPFGVKCKAYGEVINGNRVWDWIPGWGCWVTAHYTNSGCESRLLDLKGCIWC